MGNQFRKSARTEQRIDSLPPRGVMPPHMNSPHKLEVVNPIEFKKYGSSQKELLLAYLQGIPFGAQSQNQVKVIRLIHKTKFCSHPIIQHYLSDFFQLIQDFKVTGSDNDNIYSDYFAAGFIPQPNETIPEKKLMSILDEANAIESGISYDALYEYAKPHNIQQFRKQSEKYRKDLEEFLYWKENQSDSFCELFAFEEIPPFTFISHRWAEGGRALGKHNELIVLLALAKEEWIWLDCCCVPQDSNSFAKGHTMQLIWNINQYLLYAKNIATYYCTDGIDGGKYEKFAKASSGLLYLYHLLYPSRYQYSVKKMVEQENFNNSSRLWCTLERRLGAKIILKPEEYDREHLFRLLNLPLKEKSVKDVNSFELLDERPQTTNPNERNGEEYDDLNNYELAIKKLEALHANHACSLDCYCSDDIEPVTTLLYQNHTFPFLIHEQWPKYLDQKDQQYHYGILLPDLSKGEEEEDGCLYGWYYYNSTKGGDDGSGGVFKGNPENFFFICQWPNSPHPEIKSIRLQLHKSCLQKCIKGKKEAVWKYDPKKNPVLGMNLDNAYGTGSACLLCR